MELINEINKDIISAYFVRRIGLREKVDGEG